jgi:hypothetical protein
MMSAAHRISAVLLAAVLAAPVASTGAQRRNETDAYDFQIFLHSVAARKMSRTCGSGDAAYARRFGDLYPRWLARHRDRINRGESIFRDALNEQNRAEQPELDRAALEQIDKTLIELAQPPRKTGPMVLSDQTKSICDEILSDLEAGLKP